MQPKNIANTFLVDPRNTAIIHRVPVLDSIAHHAEVILDEATGCFTAPCKCGCRVEIQTGVDNMDPEVLEAMKQGLDWVPTDLKNHTIAVVYHRTSVERQEVPAYYPGTLDDSRNREL